MSRTLALALVVLAACTSQGAPGTGAVNNGSPGQPLTGTTPAAPADPPADLPAALPSIAGSLAVTDGAGGTGPFRIGEVARLQLAAACSAATPGPHTLRVDVVSPSGTVFASLPEDVVISDAGTGGASSALQVRGTNIETLLRAGTWHFTLTMDGAAPIASADVDLTE